MWHACICFSLSIILTRDLRSEVALCSREKVSYAPKRVGRDSPTEAEGAPTSSRNEDLSCRLAADHKRNDKSSGRRHLNPYRANNITSKGNRFASYSVMTALARARARARHHLTTAAIKLSRCNAYFRAGRSLPTIARSLWTATAYYGKTVKRESVRNNSDYRNDYCYPVENRCIYITIVIRRLLSSMQLDGRSAAGRTSNISRNKFLMAMRAVHIFITNSFVRFIISILCVNKFPSGFDSL